MRNTRNVKHSGQSYFRREAEKIKEMLAYTARSNVQFGEKGYMRADYMPQGVIVSYKRK